VVIHLNPARSSPEVKLQAKVYGHRLGKIDYSRKTFSAMYN